MAAIVVTSELRADLVTALNGVNQSNPDPKSWIPAAWQLVEVIREMGRWEYLRVRAFGQ